MPSPDLTSRHKLALELQPRVRFAHLPTPLEPAPRLTRALGGPTLWIKRDDCTGLGGGGNKTRKLEFLLGDAVAQGADTVLTFGAIQSNHARQTAAACARLGLQCELILSRRVDYPGEEYAHGGNRLLDELFAARVHEVEVDGSADCLAQRRAALAAEGRRVYVVPTGGSNAVGALGYVVCAEEILHQASECGFVPASIVHASSSGGTQAGLIAGCERVARSAARDATPVLGINTYARGGAAQAEQILGLSNAVLARLDEAPVAQERVRIEHAYLGSDYGQPTSAMVEAVELVAQTEGVLLDPVYSGKAMAGLIDLIRKGRFARDAHLIFLHTGGAMALPAYRAAFESGSSRTRSAV